MAMSPAAMQADEGGKSRLRQTFAAFGYPSYRILWLSMAASMTAMQMQMVARGWLSYELSGNFTAVGLVAMSWGLPQLFWSLIGGAVADRMDKRRLLFITQLAIGALAVVTAVLITADVISIPLLILIGIFQGTAFSFHMPARQALLAETVPRHQLMNAVALNNAAMNATRIIAPSLAGILIAAAGVDVVYYVQTGFYVVVLALTLALPRSTTHLAEASTRGSVVHEIGVGLRYIRSSPDLRILFVMAFVPIVLGMPYVTLLPGFAVGELGRGAQAFGAMSGVTGVGALVGSIVIASLTTFSRLRALQAAVGVLFGVSLFALGLGSELFGFPGAMVALVVLGLFSMTYMTINNTLIMTAAEPAFHGRVMSVYMLSFSFFPLMSGPMGVVADQITAITTFMLLGAGIAGFIVLISLLNLRYVFRREVGGAGGARAKEAGGGGDRTGRGDRPAPAGAGGAEPDSASPAAPPPAPASPAVRPLRPLRSYIGGTGAAAGARLPDYLAGPERLSPAASVAEVGERAAPGATNGVRGQTAAYGLGQREATRRSDATAYLRKGAKGANVVNGASSSGDRDGEGAMLAASSDRSGSGRLGRLAGYGFGTPATIRYGLEVAETSPGSSATGRGAATEEIAAAAPGGPPERAAGLATEERVSEATEAPDAAEAVKQEPPGGGLYGEWREDVPPAPPPSISGAFVTGDAADADVAGTERAGRAAGDGEAADRAVEGDAASRALTPQDRGLPDIQVPTEPETVHVTLPGGRSDEAAPPQLPLSAIAALTASVATAITWMLIGSRESE